jgi:hypothetical protein
LQNSDHDCKFARFGNELALGIDESEVRGAQLEFHGSCFTRTGLHSYKRAQPLQRRSERIMEVGRVALNYLLAAGFVPFLDRKRAAQAFVDERSDTVGLTSASRSFFSSSLMGEEWVR